MLIIPGMASDLAQTKSVRRKALREAFPHPLNQVALRHVDSVAALDDAQQLILSRAALKTDLRHVATFIDILNKEVVLVQNEDDLVALVSSPVSKEVKTNPVPFAPSRVAPADIETLANLLLKCYPDMPTTSADALARAEVMEPSLRVVQATRGAIETAGSDFVVLALFTLFEEKLNELKELINGNPAFTKAIRLNRPDWESGRY